MEQGSVRVQTPGWVLVWMTGLFFIWGFLTEMDGALILSEDLLSSTIFRRPLYSLLFHCFFVVSFSPGILQSRLPKRYRAGSGGYGHGSLGSLQLACMPNTSTS